MCTIYYLERLKGKRPLVIPSDRWAGNNEVYVREIA
jgi:hypothetical protein